MVGSGSRRPLNHDCTPKSNRRFALESGKVERLELIRACAETLLRLSLDTQLGLRIKSSFCLGTLQEKLVAGGLIQLKIVG